MIQPKKLLRWFIEWSIIALIVVLLLDGILYLVFNHPAKFGNNTLTQFVKAVNIGAARPQPAYDPACSKFDFDVNYRYREGQCRHRSWEFDVTIRANSAGFPDDEASLEMPEIIILGDSYAAGWGVEQEQAFPALLENKLDRRVLVAAAPSYATGRELWLLDEIDTSNANTVIIQFSENDAFENFEVFKNEGVTPIHHMVYRSIARTNLARKRYLDRPYFPGKYVYLVYLAFNQPVPPALPDNDSMAEHFLGILSRSKLAEMPDTDIKVVSIYESHKDDAGFVDALTAALDAQPENPLYQRVTVLGTSEILDEQDYFILDDHLRPSGHEKVASALASTLSEP